MEFKLVIGAKTGKTIQMAVKDDAAKKFVGMKIGDKFKGELLDLTGYEFEITGGSDYAGFPMRKDVRGAGRKRILTTDSTGVRIRPKGMKERKTVCGNTIHDRITQINAKVLVEGKTPLPGTEPKEEKT